MGFFSKKTVTPASGFYAMPGSYQSAYNNTLSSANNILFKNGQIDPSMFTAEGAGYNALMGGMAPTQESINSDIAMQQNPYDQYVIDAINREAQGANSIMNANQARAGQFGSNRGLLGANNIDLTRLGQIGQFKQQGFNTAMQNALTTLPGMRQTDAMNNMNLTMQNKQAPYTALQAAQGLLGGMPTQFGQFGTPQYTTKSGFGFNDVMNIAKTAASAYAMSDKSVKENIVPRGTENGFNVYEFNYIGEPDKKFIGVIAQEVQEIDPSAVININGTLSVDYNKIGVEFREA